MLVTRLTSDFTHLPPLNEIFVEPNGFQCGHQSLNMSSAITAKITHFSHFVQVPRLVLQKPWWLGNSETPMKLE